MQKLINGVRNYAVFVALVLSVLSVTTKIYASEDRTYQKNMPWNYPTTLEDNRLTVYISKHNVVKLPRPKISFNVDSYPSYLTDPDVAKKLLKDFVNKYSEAYQKIYSESFSISPEINPLSKVDTIIQHRLNNALDQELLDLVKDVSALPPKEIKMAYDLAVINHSALNIEPLYKEIQEMKKLLNQLEKNSGKDKPQESQIKTVIKNQISLKKELLIFEIISGLFALLTISMLFFITRKK